MNSMYILHLVKTWLKSFVQLPRTSSNVLGVENKTSANDAFMNFATDIKTYIISLTLVGHLSPNFIIPISLSRFP